MPFFDGSQKEIGRGAQAIVYYYKGYAYKVYKEEYPKEWIQGEILIQNEINKTGLPVVKYEKTGEPNIIKMEFISGITLADRIRKEKYKTGLEDLLQLQKKVISVTNAQLPTLKSFAVNDIHRLQVNQDRKEKALGYLEKIPEKNNLLHLDFHFSNIMAAEEKYYIIDWINARLGNPIYDYARSYVLMDEFTYRLSRKYLALIGKDREIDTTNLKKAVFVMAMLRLNENQCGEKTSKLIDTVENELA